MLGHFDDPNTGAERDLLDARTLLAGRRPVKIWSDVPPHRQHAEKGVLAIQPFLQQFPKNGVLLVAGVHVGLGAWLKYAKFERVILLYSLASHERLFVMLQALAQLTQREPELVFVSRALQLSVGLPGRVIPSLIDLRPFLQGRPDRAQSSLLTRPLTIGRLSRDEPGKHHPQDPSLYRMLVNAGIRVRIMGGTCLGGQLAGIEGIELLPAGAESPEKFFQSLDVFFYRTGSTVEAYGRVVIEAMASGLAVVAGYRGGYAEVIRNGVNGILVKTQEDAFDALLSLKNNRELMVSMGQKACDDVVLRHGERANEQLMLSWLLLA